MTKVSKNSILRITLLAAITVCTFLSVRADKYTPYNDAVRFCKEYKTISEQQSAYEEISFPAISVSDENPMVYTTVSEIVDIFKNDESALIFFGFPQSPACCNAVNVLSTLRRKYSILTFIFSVMFMRRKEEVLSGQERARSDIMKFQSFYLPYLKNIKLPSQTVKKNQ